VMAQMFTFSVTEVMSHSGTHNGTIKKWKTLSGKEIIIGNDGISRVGNHIIRQSLTKIDSPARILKVLQVAVERCCTGGKALTTDEMKSFSGKVTSYLGRGGDRGEIATNGRNKRRPDKENQAGEDDMNSSTSSSHVAERDGHSRGVLSPSSSSNSNTNALSRPPSAGSLASTSSSAGSHAVMLSNEQLVNFQLFERHLQQQTAISGGVTGLANHGSPIPQTLTPISCNTPAETPFGTLQSLDLFTAQQQSQFDSGFHSGVNEPNSIVGVH
jgi:hypothetical protein